MVERRVDAGFDYSDDHDPLMNTNLENKPLYPDHDEEPDDDRLSGPDDDADEHAGNDGLVSRPASNPVDWADEDDWLEEKNDPGFMAGFDTTEDGTILVGDPDGPARPDYYSDVRAFDDATPVDEYKALLETADAVEGDAHHDGPATADGPSGDDAAPNAADEYAAAHGRVGELWDGDGPTLEPTEEHKETAPREVRDWIPQDFRNGGRKEDDGPVKDTVVVDPHANPFESHTVWRDDGNGMEPKLEPKMDRYGRVLDVRQGAPIQGGVEGLPTPENPLHEPVVDKPRKKHKPLFARASFWMGVSAFTILCIIQSGILILVR